MVTLDIGSSSIRATLYDSNAQRVEDSESRTGHPLHASIDGTAIEYADHMIDAVEGAIDGLLDRIGLVARHIVAVGTDSMASTVLGVDDNGEALTPIYSYADNQSAAFVAQLRADLDESALHQRTGAPQHTSYVPARILWLRDTDPDLANRVHRWIDVSTFLYSRWFGNRDMPMSYSHASYSGMLDRHNLRWDSELLDYLSLSSDSMPPIASYDTSQTGLVEPFASRWPALKNVPFCLSVADGASANVGSGCVSPERMALTVGTSGAIRVMTDEPIDEVPAGLWVYRLGKTHHLLGGSFSDGGSVFAWAQDTLRLPKPDQIEAELQQMPPDEHGLTVLPFLSGERSLAWSPSATATYHGLTISTTPMQMLQAGLEAVSYRFANVHKVFADRASGPYEIVASGGAITNSPYWMQLMADALQHSLMASAEEEATSRGTAIMALNATGLWTTLEYIPPSMGTIYSVNRERTHRYQKGLERQIELYNLILNGD